MLTTHDVANLHEALRLGVIDRSDIAPADLAQLDALVAEAKAMNTPTQPSDPCLEPRCGHDVLHHSTLGECRACTACPGLRL